MRAQGLLDKQLGKPRTRRPKTAIVNFVAFHVEVLSALTFHFSKLRHNVSVFSREDYGMQDVVSPFYKKNFKWVGREAFHVYVRDQRSIAGWAMRRGRCAAALHCRSWGRPRVLPSISGEETCLLASPSELSYGVFRAPMLRRIQRHTAACVCRRIEMFFRTFHEFDTIVWTTFPTCHLQTYR